MAEGREGNFGLEGVDHGATLPPPLRDPAFLNA